MVDEDMPARSDFFDPRTWMLHAGIFERFVRPPATPRSLDAHSEPRTALRLGAVDVAEVYSPGRFTERCKEFNLRPG